jgi:hypothetical protein
MIRKLHVEVTVSEEAQMQIMKDYLKQGETAGEYVERWWRLVDHRAVGFQILIEEIQKAMWEPSDLAKAPFRSTGRNRRRQLKVATERFETGDWEKPSRCSLGWVSSSRWM